ncbi:MAG: TetR/AcrR family transcriptional regulator [Cytophagales bacterium]
MSPRTSSKNEKIRKESMQKIMNAAFSLIAQNGYESTSISQIAAEAGISKGLLYNYYESKEDLLQKLVLNAVAQGDEIMNDLVVDDPAATLENMFRWFFKEMQERPDYWRLMTELTFKIDKFSFVQDMAKEKMVGYTSFFTGILEKLKFPNAAQEAKLIGAIFDGIAIQSIVIKKDYPFDEMEAFLINKYCRKN